MSDSDPRPLVLGILASPRPRSNTGVLLARVLAAAEGAGARTELVSLRELAYRSCLHCGGCDQTGRCVVQDDLQRLHQRLRAARHLVLASPIQFAAVSGDAKAMIDRAQAFWVARYRLRRPVSELEGERRGVFVATCGGADERVFEWAKPTVKAFFNSTGFTYWRDLFASRMDEEPPVAERAELLARAQRLGEDLVRT